MERCAVEASCPTRCVLRRLYCEFATGECTVVRLCDFCRMRPIDAREWLFLGWIDFWDESGAA
jgi:hypothetical protein